MRKKISVLLCLALVLLSASGCKAQPELKKYQATFLTLFDSVTLVSGYEPDKETFTQSAQLIHDKLEVYHRLYDIYGSYEGINNLKTVNDNAGISPVAVDQRIIDLLTFAMEMYEKSGGTVNIAMGSVLKLWHDARTYGVENPEEAYLPDAAALAEAARHTDIHSMIIDSAAGMVYLADPDMRLDVGAIAKGYAVEAVSRELAAEGFDHYAVSAGGNIRTIGPRADGSGWLVGVDNPEEKNESDKYLLMLSVADMAVVTSGSDQRYYTVDGVRYHHIIAPDTLYPKNLYRSVTVVSPDSALADALSTALFNMDRQAGQSLLESLEGTEAMWVDSAGGITYSTGFEQYISDRKG
ncbi:FAD:protein FMN transferase [bioreactor metagenome]|uniref:FAD:protein FMN transferase n=1 Tax=bioreactor metagenome TaxID=1076179 RepID=A0A645AUP9_9ZZZZ